MQNFEGENTGGDSIELASYRMSRNNDEMIHSEIRALYNYWERLRGDRPCPYRAEIDPRDMTGDARHLFALEDLGRGNLRFRLGGSALHDAFGYELRGMSARSIMDGPARESFIALIAETLAEPGVGYARLHAPDGETVWEVVLLPLRGNIGQIDRLIGCLHPVSGRAAEAGDEALRFTIDEMSIHPVDQATPAGQGDAMPLPGFGEAQEGYDGAVAGKLKAIEGGLGEDDRTGGKGPKLRVVRGED